MIIDCHTHWGIVWEDRNGTDPASWLQALDSSGIDMAILMAHRSLEDPGEVVAGNDHLRQVCDRSDGRLLPVATVFPGHGEKAVEELERCLRDLDMRGLKLHPWLQGTSTAGPVMDMLAETCSRYNVPMIFHDGTPVYSMPSQIGGLAMRFPETVFVLGHSGLLDLWRSAIRSGELCENIWFTLCGPHLAAIQAIIDRIDNNRILWGSDYGFGTSNAIPYRLQLLDSVRMTDETKRRIMYENALRLFGIE